jgi:hypothetical protein
MCALRPVLRAFEEQSENINIIIFKSPLLVFAWNSATCTGRIFVTFNVFEFYKIMPANRDFV